MYLHVLRVCIVCVCAHVHERGVCTCVRVRVHERGRERDFRSHTVMRVECETAGLYGHSAVFCQGNNSSLIYGNKTSWCCFKLTTVCVCACTISANIAEWKALNKE